MRALQYEYLIRATFDSGRTRKRGADADIFRGLEHTASHLPGEKVDQFLLGVKVGEISTYLYESLNEVSERFIDNNVSQKKIQECKDLLIDPTYESICECVDEASESFASIGLLVR